MLEECSGSETAHLLGTEECEDDGSGRSRASGEELGQGEDCSGAGGVVVGSVVDYVSCRIGRVRFCYPQMVEVGGKQDNFIGICCSSEDADSVPGFDAGGVFHVGEALLETRWEGGGERAFLEEGTVVATGFETAGLKLSGGE